MELIQQFFQYILHIDSYLFSFVSHYGPWTYAVLFAVIFCETALVVFPFLPGDSLLFAAGSIAANPQSALSIVILFLLLVPASILGNKINYLIGRAIGPRVFSFNKTWLFNPKHLQETHEFYERHGGKTIILARFIPIIRSFAPFVAGIGFMDLKLFSLYNIASALLWIGLLLGAGYFLGTLPFVQQHFSMVLYGIIATSLSPPLIAFIKHKICV